VLVIYHELLQLSFITQHFDYLFLNHWPGKLGTYIEFFCAVWLFVCLRVDCTLE
jgi:hypothetical protein